MSSITASTLLPGVTFHGHGHRRGAQGAGGQSLSSAVGSSRGGSIGQLPVGVSSALFGNLVQSFQQTLGAQPPASSGSVPELQAFQHSLFQALKQDGLSANGTGNVVSSLKTLIGQLGPGGKATAATSTLSSTFQNLLSGVNGAGSASGSSSSNSALQNFLGNLLQNLQASGAQSIASTGTNVNTHV